MPAPANSLAGPHDAAEEAARLLRQRGYDVTHYPLTNEVHVLEDQVEHARYLVAMLPSEWDSCTDAQAMLAYLNGRPGVFSDRKLRLFALDCVRLDQQALTGDERLLVGSLVKAAGAFADEPTEANRLAALAAQQALTTEGLAHDLTEPDDAANLVKRLATDKAHAGILRDMVEPFDRDPYPDPWPEAAIEAAGKVYAGELSPNELVALLRQQLPEYPWLAKHFQATLDHYPGCRVLDRMAGKK